MDYGKADQNIQGSHASGLSRTARAFLITSTKLDFIQMRVVEKG